MKAIKTKQIFKPDEGVNITYGTTYILRLNEKLTGTHAGYHTYNIHILDSYISKSVRTLVFDELLFTINVPIISNIQHRIINYSYMNQLNGINKSSVLKSLK